MSELAISADEAFVGTVEPEGADRLDEGKLTEWMQANVAGFKGPLHLTKFKGGQSNPTYKIEAASGNYVLRRKPFGPLLPSAHAVDREYKVQNALNKAGFPARASLACAPMTAWSVRGSTSWTWSTGKRSGTGPCRAPNPPIAATPISR